MSLIPIKLFLLMVTSMIAPVPLSTDELERQPAEPTGPLMIVGGGQIPAAVIEQFVESIGAADAKLVVIPTAAAEDSIDEQSIIERWHERGVASVTVLHSRQREMADSKEFVQPLLEATGVWIGGGQQSRLTDAYVDTRTQAELKALIERGGTVGGTSAGAAIMSTTMIASGREIPVLQSGLGLFGQAIIDQHFLKRNRLNRLRWAVEQHDDLVGIGIDESTAIIVRQTEFEVIGASYVIVLRANDGAIDSIESYRAGDTVDLDERQ